MTSTTSRIVVVGSCNLDEVLVGQEFPGPGVTMSADSLREEPGGKGLNQALAVARMGVPVTFVGATGADAAAEAVRGVLVEAGVDIRRLRAAPGPTGRAVIFVDGSHENRIVLVAGANASLTQLETPDRAAVADAGALLLQLEVPLTLVVQAAETAASAGVPVALTPAPVRELPERLVAATSILFANESEAREIAGSADLDACLGRLLLRVPEVVVTRGEQGSDYASRDGLRLHLPARQVEVVDTTGAGDVYAGVFMATRCRGGDIEEAMRQATTAASLAVQRRGTSSAVPTAAAVAEVLTATHRGLPRPRA